MVNTADNYLNKQYEEDESAELFITACHSVGVLDRVDWFLG